MTRSNGKKHPESSMTLREAFERHYPKDELATRTIEKARYDLKRWEKLTSNPPVGGIDETVLEDFRKATLGEPHGFECERDADTNPRHPQADRARHHRQSVRPRAHLPNPLHEAL